jgi:hypothetical protein
MEKTWEIREQELRGEIAQVIELAIEGISPPTDEVEQAVCQSLIWAAGIARGDDASS